MPFRPRILVLPIAALVLVALCVWRLSRNDLPSRARGNAALVGRTMVAPAPELVERNHEFWPKKLSAFVTRHPIVVAFFDGRLGADKSPLLLRLKRDHDALERLGYVVIAIGDAHPDANREALRRVGGFPFEVLSDVDADLQVDYDTFARWGRFDADTGRVKPGLVLVDRTGFVKWDGEHPLAEADPDNTLDRILGRSR